MSEKLLRVGTTYLPVRNVGLSAEWYVSKLNAVLSYQDEDKAIVNLAGQSFFLVKGKAGETSNFDDINGNERFSLTFEVDGIEALKDLHQEFIRRNIKVGEIEDRGHAGKNFVFSDPNGNKFDVWSELSPYFKERFRH
nr:VOC family protein [Neobacillus sp. Marseille-Q6967]